MNECWERQGNTGSSVSPPHSSGPSLLNIYCSPHVMGGNRRAEGFPGWVSFRVVWMSSWPPLAVLCDFNKRHQRAWIVMYNLPWFCIQAVKLFGVCSSLAEVVREPHQQDQSWTWTWCRLISLCPVGKNYLNLDPAYWLCLFGHERAWLLLIKNTATRYQKQNRLWWGSCANLI